MADSDSSLNILITTRAELSGARQLEAALERDIGKAKALGAAYDEQAAKLQKVRGSISDAVAANKSLGASQEEAGKAGESAMRRLGEETGHTHERHKLLHEAIKGMKEEFPQLAHIAHFALNPITLLVATISGAWALWHERVKSLTDALAGVELPDNEALKPGHVDALAAEWDHYADAVNKTVTAYNSVAAASDREIEKIKKEVEQQKILLAARKGEELASLEASKGSLQPGQYERSKADIDQRYADAGLRTDDSGNRRIINARAARAGALSSSAAQKRAQASGIRIASADDDTNTERDLKAKADTATKSIEERTKRIGTLIDFMAHDGVFSGAAGPATRAGFAAYALAKYGVSTSPDQAIAMERQGLGYDHLSVSNYDDFMRRKNGRDRLRKTRSDLFSEAADEDSQARILRQSVPEEIAAQRHQESLNTQVSNTEAVTRLAGTGVGQVAKESLSEALLSTRDLEHHKQVSQESKDNIINVGSAIAGHKLSLEQAEQQIQIAGRNIESYNASMLRIVDFIERYFGNSSNSLVRRLDQLESRMNRSRSP